MNSHVADDFHAALLALKELESEGHSETPAEEETVQLVDEVFAFLEILGPSADGTYAPFERIAA